MAEQSWRPVRPLKPWPPLNPQPFDTRQSIFIPEASVGDEQIRSVSSRKIAVLGAKVFNSAAQSIANTTITALSFDTEEYDEGDLFTSGTKLHAPYAGVYAVTGLAEFANGAGNDRRIYVYVNGSQVMRTKWPIIATLTTECFIHGSFRVNAGDYFELRVRQDSGGGLNVNGGVTSNFLTVMFQGEI